MLSCVIPALDEEAAIGETIDILRSVLEKAGIAPYEILVVDDGSTDNTGTVAAAHGARVVTHLQCAGYGRSLKDGIAAASHDTIVISDADGTYPLEDIPVLLKEFQRGFSMVVGARQGAHYRESLVKSPLRWVLRQMVEFTAGRRIPDINSGLRIFSRSEVMPYYPHLCNTFSFTTSLTLAYMMTGKFVEYVPISYSSRIGRSKVRLFRDSLRTLQYIVQAILYYDPIKIFIVMSGMTAAGSLAILAVALLTAVRTGIFLGVGGLLVSVVIFSLGLLAELLKQIMDQNAR